MTMLEYDENNVFAKILRGDLPCKKVYEDEMVLAFWDIYPNAPVHVLVIPKGNYISFKDFVLNCPYVACFFKTVGKIAEQLDLAKNGYRVVTNYGEDAGQVVPHFHVHILGGKKLSPI